MDISAAELNSSEEYQPHQTENGNSGGVSLRLLKVSALWNPVDLIGLWDNITSPLLCPSSVFGVWRRSKRREGGAGGWDAGGDDSGWQHEPELDPGGDAETAEHGGVSAAALWTPRVWLKQKPKSSLEEDDGGFFYTVSCENNDFSSSINLFSGFRRGRLSKWDFLVRPAHLCPLSTTSPAFSPLL